MKPSANVQCPMSNVVYPKSLEVSFDVKIHGPVDLSGCTVVEMKQRHTFQFVKISFGEIKSNQKLTDVRG